MPKTRARAHERVPSLLNDRQFLTVFRSRFINLLTDLTSTTTIVVVLGAPALAIAAVTNGEKPEMQAVRAMRSRGIDNPESLLALATPAAILATCNWWDARVGVGPGLLAKKIREGGIEIEEQAESAADRRDAERRSRFAELAERFPTGSTAESHARMQARRWPDDPARCVGELVVLNANYPTVAVRCDVCAFEAAYPIRALIGTRKPEPEKRHYTGPQAILPQAPTAVGLPEPAPHRPAAMATPVTSVRPDGLRRHPRIPDLHSNNEEENDGNNDR